MALVAGCLLILILLLKLAHIDDEGITYFGDEMVPEETDVPEAREIAQSTEPVWYKATIGKGETLGKIFNRYYIDKNDLTAITALPIAKKYLTKLTAGKDIKFSIDSDYHLQELTYQLNMTTTVLITRTDSGFTAETERKPIETRLTMASGKIQSSLSLAGKKAKLPDKITVELAKIFSMQIDFAKDIRPGSHFKVIYEKDFVGNKEIRVGNLLAAEFSNQGHTYRAVRFVGPNGQVGYYTPEGKGLQKAFSRNPLGYARVNSPFNPNRMHPILHYKRPHMGVDLKATAGTPIKATGDAKVSFVGKKGGYGNVVILSHSHQVTTLYAHMRKFAPGIAVGKSVKHGQVIGYVGSTGLASGPHLHFEYHINGKAHNPMTVKLPASNPVPKAYQRQFAQKSKLLIAQLDGASRSMNIAAGKTTSKKTS